MPSSIASLDGHRPVRTNRLLAALPMAEYAQLEPDLERVSLRNGEVIYEPGQPISAVYFPVTAVVSILTVLLDGVMVEVALAGNYEVVGLPLVLGLDSDTNQALCQVPGEALRLSTPAFRHALAAQPAFRGLMQRSLQVVLVHMSQAAACNRLHPIDERCARWLLETHDRVEANSFSLTQEFLASMLGVRRPSVTIAAGMLQQAGMITYRRGRVTILDREGLEEAACECYGTIAKATAMLLGITSDPKR